MKDNKNKIASTFYFVAAFFFYIAAIIGFTTDKSYAPMYLCLGSAMLCFGCAGMKRAKSEEDDTNEEE